MSVKYIQFSKLTVLHTRTMTRGVTRGTLAGSDLTLPGAGDWAEVGEVARLYIYPVKSMAGVR